MGDDLSSRETKNMAKYSAKKNTKIRKTKKKASNASQLKKLAYQMGQVERGLKNPNSQISESYNNGKHAKRKNTKKPLF